MKYLAIAAAAMFAAGAASASSVTPTFTFVGSETGSAQNSGVFRADLSGLGLSTLGSITVTDDNSGTSGAAGAYSGFDLDALFLDLDGDYTTTADQIFASSFVFTPGTIRPGGLTSNTTGPLNGMNADGTVNEAFATLNAIDAIFFGTGSISLGDGGSLSANFSPEVPVPGALFIIVAEVGNNGESVDGLITISEDPVDMIPLPAGAWLLLGGLGALGVARRLRIKA